MTDQHIYGPDADLLQPLFFICFPRGVQNEHVHTVQRIERKLAAKVRAGRIRLWWDDRLRSGEEFDESIAAQIASADGAIVLVGDDFYASSYIQDREFPALLRRNEEESFRLFLIALNRLDEDDELMRTYNFVNDPVREPWLSEDEQTSRAQQDRILTALSDEIGRYINRGVELPSLQTDDASSGGDNIGLAGVRFEPTSGSWTAAAQNREIRAHDWTDEKPRLEDNDRLTTAVGLSVRRAGLHGVPQLPEQFAAPVELERVIDQLHTLNTAGIAGLGGEGGTGKSVLAAAVARVVVDDFPAGVHWVTVGEHASQEDVRRTQESLLLSLGEETGLSLRDMNEGFVQLRRAMEDRAALLVVDDVWEPWQARMFDVAAERGSNAVLFTTRFIEVLPRRTQATEIRRLALSDARLFLRTAAGFLPEDEDDQLAVLNAAGGLRLALAVLAAVARRADTWQPVLEALEGLSDRFGSGDDAASAHKALHISAATLEPDEERRLQQLAAFPADVQIPNSVVALLWGLSSSKTSELIERLAEAQIVKPVFSGDRDEDRTDAIELHDHASDFLVLRSSQSPMKDHLTLTEIALDLASATSQDSPAWPRLAEHEPYLWDRLVWHLCRAGVRGDRLLQVIGNTAWMAERIGRDGAAAAQQDVARSNVYCGAGSGSWSVRFERVLRHGRLFDELSSQTSRERTVAAWFGALGGGSDDGDPTAVLSYLSGDLPVPSPALTLSLLGHTSGVRRVAYSLDGTRVATASNDGTAQIWNAMTGEVVVVLNGHTAVVRGVAFSPDGIRVATASNDGTVRIWNTTTGEVAIEFMGHTTGVWGVAYSPDGTRLATVGGDGTVQIWNAGAGEVVAAFMGHTAGVWGVAYSPDGTHLATGSRDGTARIWDVVTGEVIAVLTGHAASIWGVAFSPDGSRLATASYDGTCQIWNIATGEVAAEFTGHTATLRSLAFSPDGAHLVTASDDATARIWDVVTGQVVAVLTGHTAGLWGAAYSPDGTRLVTSSNDGTARIWSTAIGEATTDFASHSAGVRSVVHSPDGIHLATASNDGTARIWDVVTGQVVAVLTGHTAGLWGAAYSPDGTHLVTTCDDGTARIWNTTTGEVATELTEHTASLRGVACSPDGIHLATASSDGSAQIWNTTNGEVAIELTGHTAGLWGVAYSPDGTRLVTTSSDGTARIWNTTTGDVTAEFIGHTAPVRGVAYSPDGIHLATTSNDGTARIWNATTCEVTAELISHSAGVWGVAYSPDGTYLATNSNDGTARIWNATTGEPLLALGLATSRSLAWMNDRIALAAERNWIVLTVDLDRLAALRER